MVAQWLPTVTDPSVINICDCRVLRGKLVVPVEVVQAEEFQENLEMIGKSRKSQDHHPVSPLRSRVDSVCGELLRKKKRL